MTENNKDNGSFGEEVIEGSLVGTGEEATVNETDRLGQKEPVTPGKKRGLFLISSLFVVIVLLSAFAAAGYWLWLDYQARFSALSDSQATLSEELSAARHQIQQLETRGAQIDNEWQAGVKSLENMVERSAQRWNREANRTENRWPLEEALTLTRLAQQRLQLDSNATVAVGLLKAADNVLLGLEDPTAVISMRRQIASDIFNLEKTAAVDINGSYFELENIASEIKALTWTPKPLEVDVSKDLELDEGFLQGLKKIFVVTELDKPMEAPPLLTDFERWRQYQLLLIEQVQLALLARNQALFDQALLQTREYLSLMSNQYDLAVSLSRLGTLTNARLNPQWPDISQSTFLIEQYLAERPAEEVTTVEGVSQ